MQLGVPVGVAVGVAVDVAVAVAVAVGVAVAGAVGVGVNVAVAVAVGVAVGVALGQGVVSSSTVLTVVRRRVETVGDQHSAIGQGALRVPGAVADHRRAGAERTATDGEDVGGGGGVNHWRPRRR